MTYLSTAPETPWARAPLPITAHGLVLDVIMFFSRYMPQLGLAWRYMRVARLASYIILISPPYILYICLSTAYWFLCCIIDSYCLHSYKW